MYLMLQRQLSHLKGRKLDCRQVKAVYIFYVWFRIVLCCERVHSHDFVRLYVTGNTLSLRYKAQPVNAT
jgi:hypothetical protein